MEEKFLEEVNKLLKENQELFTQNKKNINKNIIYFILSEISFLPFYNINLLLVFISILSSFIYNLKKINDLIEENIELEIYIKYKKYIEETYYYKEVLKEYKELILRLTDLFDKNKINSLVDIQSSFVFMQKNGYLSKEHIWKYKNLINKMYLKNDGISIINGGGVCRDLSHMLNDLLKNMDFYTIPTIIRIDGGEASERLHSFYSIETLCQILNIDIDRLSPSIKKIDDSFYSEIDENKIEENIKNIFNHVVVSTEYNGKVYHFDPTNHLYFKSYDEEHLSFYDEDTILQVGFREYGEENKHLLSLPNPNKEEIYSLYNEYYVKNLLERERIYQKFYEDNKENYKRINEKIKIINKYW